MVTLPYSRRRSNSSGINLIQREMISISPEIGVEPGKLVGSATARHSCDKLDDRLIRDSNGAASNSTAQQVCRNGLLLWKARVESVDQNVGIDEREHSVLV